MDVGHELSHTGSGQQRQHVEHHGQAPHLVERLSMRARTHEPRRFETFRLLPAEDALRLPRSARRRPYLRMPEQTSIWRLT